MKTKEGQTLTHVRQKNSDLPLRSSHLWLRSKLSVSLPISVVSRISEVANGFRYVGDWFRCCLVCKFWSISFFSALILAFVPPRDVADTIDTIHMRWTGTTGSRCPWGCPKVERLGTKPSIATATAYPNISFAHFRFVISNVCQIGRQLKNPSST